MEHGSLGGALGGAEAPLGESAPLRPGFLRGCSEGEEWGLHNRWLRLQFSPPLL